MKFKAPSRAVSSLTLGMALLVATTIFAQKFSTPQDHDAVTARSVCRMIQNDHISRRFIDDDISAKLLDRYLKELDSQKMYFLQADIDRFKRYRDELDDLVKMGNVDFAYTTFDLFLKRFRQRYEVIKSLIDAKHDFSINEEMHVDADTLPWATSENDINERWRKRIKYELLTLKLGNTPKKPHIPGTGKEESKKGTPLEEARKQLKKRYRAVYNDKIQTEDIEKLEMYLSSLSHCFDPHSSYMSPRTLEDFRISMNLRLEGIGAALRSDDGYTIVATIVPGGAADKDGRLEVGDKIIGVRQDDTTEYVDVVEMKLKRSRSIHSREKGNQSLLESPQGRHQRRNRIRVDPSDD